jgi:hypothetical protein
MTKKTEELLFVAECTDAERKPRQVYVYKNGRAFILRSGAHSKVCHTSIRTDDDIKREIGLVYDVTVTSIKYPWELNKPTD